MTPTQAARYLRILGWQDDDPLFSTQVDDIVATTQDTAALKKWRGQLEVHVITEWRKVEEATRAAKRYEAAADFIKSLLLVGG